MATDPARLTPTAARLAARATTVVATIAVAGLCLPATPAWAHAVLLRTSPADTAQVATPVATVTLTFNEMVRQRSTTVTVTAADATSYSDGAARVVDHDVIQAVRPLPAGTYRVVWKTVSADGDPETGQFGFTITAPPSPSPTPAATDPSPTPPSQPAAVTTEPSRTATAATAGSGWMWAVAAAAVALAALAAGAIVWRRRRTS